MYLVYVTARENFREMFMRGARDDREILIKAKMRQNEERVDEGMLSELLEIGTVMIDTKNAEKDATEVASRFAKMRPLEDVYIAKVTGVVSTAAPAVVFKSVSEKGVLPA